MIIIVKLKKQCGDVGPVSPIHQSRITELGQYLLTFSYSYAVLALKARVSHVTYTLKI